MSQKHINDLKARVGDLRQQLAEAEARLKAAQIEASGVKVGDVVVSRGKRYRVLEIEPRPWGGTWLYGSPEKNDGTFGIARHYISSGWKLEAAP